MKKILVISLLLLMVTTGCSTKKNTTFTATVDNVSESSIMITTADNVGFDKASVGYNKGYKPDFEIKAGQKLEITILPEIRESYPVQVTAVKIKLLEDENKVEYKKITGEQAANMMTDDVIIIDARTKEEFNEGHIKNAILLPYDQITEDTANEIIPDKSKTVLVHCRTGRRSEIASKTLISLGYTSIYDFGGIATDWKGEVVK